MNKICTQCRESKPLSEFYKNRCNRDGLSVDCKTCKKAYQKKLYQSNPEKIKINSRNWYKDNKEKAFSKNKEWRQNNPERSRAISRNWQHNNPEKVKNIARRMKIIFPEKIRARNAVNNAVRDGKIPSPKTLLCSCCGNQAMEYHHHKGYDEIHWLDVRPYCHKCHKIIEALL